MTNRLKVKHLTALAIVVSLAVVGCKKKDDSAPAATVPAPVTPQVSLDGCSGCFASPIALITGVKSTNLRQNMQFVINIYGDRGTGFTQSEYVSPVAAYYGPVGIDGELNIVQSECGFSIGRYILRTIKTGWASSGILYGLQVEALNSLGQGSVLLNVIQGIVTNQTRNGSPENRMGLNVQLQSNGYSCGVTATY